MHRRKYITERECKITVDYEVEGIDLNTKKIACHLLGTVIHDIGWLFEIHPLDICQMKNSIQVFYRDFIQRDEFSIGFDFDQEELVLKWHDWADPKTYFESSSEKPEDIICDLAAHMGIILEEREIA